MKQLAMKPTQPLTDILRDIAWTGALFAFSVAIGFALLVLMFKLHLQGDLDILFYRGLVLIALAGFLTFTILLFAAPAFRAKTSAVFSAAVLSMSFNLSFLVIFPVTIDRSVSVFLLGYMAQRPDTSFSTTELRGAFDDIYLVRYRQIERRMHEQLVSGNIEHDDGRYRISDQGRSFVSFARDVSWLFDTDSKLITPQSAQVTNSKDTLHHP